VLSQATDQAYMIDGLHRISAGLGGLTRSWRIDRDNST
jgi:hypothetical protein